MCKLCPACWTCTVPFCAWRCPFVGWLQHDIHSSFMASSLFWGSVKKVTGLPSHPCYEPRRISAVLKCEPRLTGVHSALHALYGAERHGSTKGHTKPYSERVCFWKPVSFVDTPVCIWLSIVLSSNIMEAYSNGEKCIFIWVQRIGWGPVNTKSIVYRALCSMCFKQTNVSASVFQSYCLR